MSAGTIDQDTSLDATLEHLVYTLVLLLAHPHTGQLATPYEQQLEQWWVIDRAETERWIEILKAAARIVAADNRLDELVDRLANTVTAKSGSRKSDEYKYFFGSKPPSEVKRPVLSGQLATMEKWVDTLKGSSDPDLAALGAEIEAAAVYAREQEKLLASAQEANKSFRKLGDRKAFMDAVNALRKTTWGDLAEMPHAHPELRLPSGFADQFFKPVRKPRAKDEGPQTAAEMHAVVADLEAQLDEARVQLASLEAEEAAAAEAKAQREADEAELAEAERDAKAAQAKIAALRAKLAK